MAAATVANRISGDTNAPSIIQLAVERCLDAPVADEKELVDAAKEERILAVPGSAFACPGYIRLSFCIANETIHRSAESFAKLGKKYFG